ncbi:MAG: fermentation-respiration switch protein FrsA (DUF1100 family) [Hyphomicrobiaceae bacterium]|jgi:fermentation-respiration switch protein FrsA (DUF1100 family)
MFSALQAKFLYFPTRELIASPADAGLEFENLTIKTGDGVALHGWWIPAGSERGAVIFLHGNAGNISHRIESYSILRDLGLSVLAIDYRGYGRSEGRPSENGTYEDARAAWHWLSRNKGFDKSRIVIVGRSLGGGVASDLAVRVEPAALVLESTFTSIRDMAARVFPLPGVARFATIGYDNFARVQAIRAPKLFIHSPTDQVVPFEQGRRLFEVALGPKEFLEISGTHADGFVTSGRVYIDGLARFLDRILDQ